MHLLTFLDLKLDFIERRLGATCLSRNYIKSFCVCRESTCESPSPLLIVFLLLANILHFLQNFLLMSSQKM